MKKKTMKVKWFCKNCWQRGMADLDFTSIERSPTQNDILSVLKTICHNSRCMKPGIVFTVLESNMLSICDDCGAEFDDPEAMWSHACQ